MEKNLKDGHSNFVQIRDSVALRLKEFTNVTGHNPDQLADLILTQWMDDQLRMYGDKWNITGDKASRMSGVSEPEV